MAKAEEYPNRPIVQEVRLNQRKIYSDGIGRIIRLPTRHAFRNSQRIPYHASTTSGTKSLAFTTTRRHVAICYSKSRWQRQVRNRKNPTAQNDWNKEENTSKMNRLRKAYLETP